ncbi:polysaccharide deacetylase family protein [Joostella sp. CR20]|uniref:polysaccharide deacetylase family protein n=1 Tax=Joostella sp. CR20 TaxID=2804312 RepID=UPI00313C891F
MKTYIAKAPKLLKLARKSLVWDIKTDKKEVFLTFDDGPTPEVTEFVLAELKKYQAKATFFCIGKNIVNHPEVFEKVKTEGHSIGNHTHNHFNCAKHSHEAYIENIKLTEDILSNHNCNTTQKLFRPPYGRISFKATKTIQQKGFKIIMWDVISGDFDTNISAEKCTSNVLNNVQPGSIVIFHDSVKAFPRLKETLPTVLSTLQNQGYSFSAIKQLNVILK